MEEKEMKIFLIIGEVTTNIFALIGVFVSLKWVFKSLKRKEK